jgi:putative ubiquitin-RnfH superfamily antitoxin RatB of RatAB toxin-antitoxin module
MKVELFRAWPRRFERIELEVVEAATVRDAVLAAGWDDDPDVVAYAIFGQRVDSGVVLHDGDRVELLRPLLADPKEARRQRVEERRRIPKK